MNINERIKLLRKEVLKLTQQEFSSGINISRSNIANIEIGNVAVTDRIITDICNKYFVSEDWLRNGSGEMFITKAKNQIIADFAGKLIKENDSFKKRLFEALAELDEDDWKTLEKIVGKFVNKKE